MKLNTPFNSLGRYSSTAIKIIILVFFAVISLSTQAAIRLPELISDYMLLQQQTSVTLWGTAEAGNTLSVYSTWGAQASTKVDKDGHWLIHLTTPAASYTEHSLTFIETPRVRDYYAPDPVQINHVLIGEVWFAGGQSNMEMPLQGFWQCPIEDGNRVIATAGDHAGHIRYAIIDRVGAYTPQDFVTGRWYECNAFNAPRFGATAYFFAEMLERVLRVPVGVINCSWGGTKVEGWLPKEILEEHCRDFNINPDTLKSCQYEWSNPLIMYNGMIYPCHNYTIRGFLWYQGCSNVGRANTYAERLAWMVNHWRQLWGEGNLPFYFVEIAPYSYDNPSAIWGAELREAQWDLMNLVPNVDGVCTNDLVYDYEVNNIHPAQKRAVGERLAYLALNRDYGFKTIACESPHLEHYDIVGNEVQCYFSNCSDGFSRWEDIRGFEIIDAEGNAHPARWRAIEGKSHAMAFYSPDVAEPKALRYCFHNFSLGNLASCRYLPIVPFRTDKPQK